MDQMMDHLPHLRTVAEEDVAEVLRKENTYRGSWRRGGGVNAWHMARRKIDRLNVMLAPPTDSDVQNLKDFAECVEEAKSTRIESLGPVKGKIFGVVMHGIPAAMAATLRKFIYGEDIFHAMDADTSGADGTVLAEVRDLRRYLLLFEARLVAEQARRVVPLMLVPETERRTYSAEIIAVADTFKIPTFAAAYAVECERPASELVKMDIRDPDSNLFFSFDAEHGVQAVRDAYAERTARLVPRAVPAEDSSRHAERISADVQATVTSAGGLVARQVVSRETYDRCSTAVQELFVPLKRVALADRDRLDSHDRDGLTRHRVHITDREWQGRPDWSQDMYFPYVDAGMPGVAYAMILRLREHWGQREVAK